MRKQGVVFAFILLAATGLAGTNDLDVAREALRDGLWNVARTHALRVNDDKARLIVLETYAREANWKGLLAAIDAMGYPEGEGFAYYRAAALFNGGQTSAASNLVYGATFRDADFVRPAARLKASIAVSVGNLSGALAILEKDGGDDVETKLMRASVLRHGGSPDTAARLWHEVLANAQASERARALAAAGLGDVKGLREVLKDARSGSVRRLAELELGVVLVRDDATFAEGERLIRGSVRDKPDAEKACDAFLALADALLAHEEWAKAERAYAEALEIWPALSKESAIHEARGWALAQLGRTDDALGALRRAEALSTDPQRKAMTAVKAADVLAASGRVRESLAAYQKVREDYPGTAAAMRVAEVVRLRATEDKGRALYREFKFDEASKVFADLAKEDPPRSEHLAFYGVLCAYGSGREEAAEASARTLAAGAKNATVRANATLWLAKLAFNRKDWREAKNLFDTFATLMPKSEEAPRALVWAARAALADNDFKAVIATVTRLVADYPGSSVRAAGMLAQGEALIELARFDEAVLVLDRVPLVSGVSGPDRLDASVLRADALFAMGADNPSRYHAALDAYNAIRTGESLTPGAELLISFKVAKTLEKLKRMDEAIDMYYTQVVLAYRTGRIAGIRYDDDARATFARAAFRLAEEYESRGRIRQAVHVLDLVRTSDVQAAGEAANRIDRLTKKGRLL